MLKVQNYYDANKTRIPLKNDHDLEISKKYVRGFSFQCIYDVEGKKYFVKS